ncbi:MAG TPA: hypothetical protein VJ276_22070 [Thermoanaerobaculia bacterium]|nr:hypothetical protein [Thermoanaerobaculia bacterium]
MSDEPLGIEGITDDDRNFTGSRFAEVREAVFANPYQPVWNADGGFERYPVTFGKVASGAFVDAAKRTVASHAVLRWGPDRKGYRRIVHPNGICLTGMWEIAEETPYSGYFRKGSRGLMIARYSTCCTETRRGNTRSLAMVGIVYPTTDPEHTEPLKTAAFITQEDIGGADSVSINEAVLRNAPNTTATKRGSGIGTLIATGVALNKADKKNTIRQVYQLAELGKADGEPTRAPEFMQLTVVPEQPVIAGDGLDFRDEIMAQLYDRGDPAPKRKLVFRIETSDEGVTKGLPIKERRTIINWRPIGTMTFDAAVVSYNGDHVFHVNHPKWREDRNVG